MEAYKDDKGQGYFKLSYCAYFDILGFSDKIRNHNLTFFNKYLDLLEKEMGFLQNDPDFKVKVFTDNFVIGLPWKDPDAEPELGLLFDILARIQFKFAIADIFIIGAISVSNLFMDDNTVLGPALIEAYNLESKEQYPRIVLSEDTIKKVKEHIGYYRDPGHAPQSKSYLMDIDGSYFINYLKHILDETHGNTEVAKNYLKKHKLSVERNLKNYRDNFKVLSKFLWIAGYHNYFCENFMLNLRKKTIQKLSIDEKLMDLSIKQAHEA